MAEMSRQVQNDPKWKHYNLATGHDAMLTAPAALSKLLCDTSRSEKGEYEFK